MGRPTKKGIDFFPVDVSFDDKVELFIAENGPESLSVLVTTWQLIYGSQGYYIDYSDDLFLLIKRRLLLDESRTKAIIEAAVRRGIFSADHLQKHGILTSKAIQLNYMVASRKKKTVFIVKEYLCNGVSDAGNTNTIWISDAENATKEDNSGISDAGNAGKDENGGVFDGGNATKEEEEEEKNILHSRSEVFKTKRRRLLKGDTLNSFNVFWDAFNYKQGKAEAADAWLDVYAPDIAPLIIEAASREAEARPTLLNKGRTPKMAQGWLSGRRWEDEPYQPAESKEEEWI